MHTDTYIPGKDASLETTIETLQGRLAALGIHVEERSWLNPIHNIWSVHISERDCPLLFTNGKGGSRLAALASALGEFFERMSTNYFWTHYYLGEEIANRPYVHFPQEKWFPLGKGKAWPKGLLSEELREFYDPDRLIPARMLVDANSGNEARGICALPFVRQRDGETVWFPVNILGNLYVSNGMSAGNTPAEARTQALAEIYERNVKFRVIAEGLCLPDVPEEAIARYPRIAQDIRDLRDAGFGILVKDASLGGEYPVINVTLLNPRDQGCFASFGAHPRFEIALERALTELLQGRGLDALDGFPEPGFDLDEIASAPNLEIHFVDSSGVIAWDFLRGEANFPFHDWNFSTTTGDDYAWLLNRAHADGCDVYVAEYTHLGVYTCRILVPGISEIYPVDDLEYENTSVANRLRPSILRLPELGDDECEGLLKLLNDLGVDDQRPVAGLVGLAADPGTLWEDMRVGELKALLALACHDEEGIAEGLDWVCEFAQFDESRRRVYRCMRASLELDDAEDFQTALALLYGEETLRTAQAMLSGEARFFGIAALGKDMLDSAMHRRLLEAYRKVHQG